MLPDLPKPLCLRNLHGLSFQLYIFVPIMEEGTPPPPLRPRPPHTPPPPRKILATDLHDKACSSPQIKLSRYGHEKETARHSALYPTISNALRVLLTLSTLTLTLRRSKTCFSKSKYIILCFIDRTNQYIKICGSISDISTCPQLNIFVYLKNMIDRAKCSLKINRYFSRYFNPL